MLAAVLFVILQWVAFTPMLAGGLAGLTLVVNATVISLRYQSHASTPLAVNMNHPFVMDEPMGKAEVMVKMSSGTWCDPGAHRVRVIPDELLGGFSLVQDTADYPVIGHFLPKSALPHWFVMALINQAIALRDAVNEVPDPIEGAREREAMETGLFGAFLARGATGIGC